MNKEQKQFKKTVRARARRKRIVRSGRNSHGQIGNSRGFHGF